MPQILSHGNPAYAFSPRAGLPQFARPRGVPKCGLQGIVVTFVLREWVFFSVPLLPAKYNEKRWSQSPAP